MKRIAVLLLVSRAAFAAPSEAEKLYKDGQAAYDDKRYDDAIAAWSRSYELSHLPGLVFNLAQAYRLKGECEKAVETYQKFIDLDPKSKQRTAAEGFLHELQPCHVDQPPPPPEPPPPPPHVDQPPLHVDQPPPPPPPPVDHGRTKRLAGMVTIGAGVVAFAGGAYFGSQASSLADEVKKACMVSCDYSAIKDKDSSGRTDETVQWIMYGVGAAGVGVGVALYLMGTHEHAPVAVTPVQGGAAVTWSGRF